MEKRKLIFRIVICTVLACVLVIAGLIHIPIVKLLKYEMQGYIVRPDGEILEEFNFTITGKDYNFILDYPGGEVHFSGNTLKKLTRDAIVLYPHWDSSRINEDFAYGHFNGSYSPDSSRHIYGTLMYIGDVSAWNTGTFILDTEAGTFCMYAEDLAYDAFIVGVPTAETDLMPVIQYFTERVNEQNLPPSSVN